jgi:membrane protein DedA with SNARE-associated domain
MVPAIMAPLSVVAGMMRVPVAVFTGGVSLSTLAWAGLLAGLGAVCGRALGDLALPASGIRCRA